MVAGRVEVNLIPRQAKGKFFFWLSSGPGLGLGEWAVRRGGVCWLQSLTTDAPFQGCGILFAHTQGRPG